MLRRAQARRSIYAFLQVHRCFASLSMTSGVRQHCAMLTIVVASSSIRTRNLHFSPSPAYVPAHSTWGDEQMRNALRLAVLGLILAAFAQAQTAKPGDEVWAIRATNLLDGKSDQPQHDKAIIIR